MKSFTTLLNNFSTLDSILEEALQNTSQYLSRFIFDAKYTQKLETAFGNDFNRSVANQLFDDFAKGKFKAVPTIEIVSRNDINGANGAFSITTGKIYLAGDFISQNAQNVNAVAAVLLEEIGHFVDSRINTKDTAGDEGDIFARLVQGDSLSQQELAVLQAEDDSATVTLDGQVVEIEMAALSTNNTRSGDPFNDVGETLYAAGYWTVLGAYDENRNLIFRNYFVSDYKQNVYGYGGNDRLIGGDQNDYLAGGNGNDRLKGGNGSDTFSFKMIDSGLFNGLTFTPIIYFTDGIDVISDFNWREGDKIQVVFYAPDDTSFFSPISTYTLSSLDGSTFSYNSSTGALSFYGTQFATLEQPITNTAPVENSTGLKVLDKQKLEPIIQKAWQKKLNTPLNPAGNNNQHLESGPDGGGGLYGELSDYANESLDFEEDKKVYAPSTEIATTSTTDNRNGLSTLPDDVKLGYTFTKKSIYSNTWTYGGEIKLGVTVTGWKKLGEAGGVNFEFKGTLNMSNTKTTEESEAITYEVTKHVKVPAGKVYKTVLYFDNQKLTVPYSHSIIVSGKSHTWFETPVNGHYNWKTDNAGELFEWINHYEAAGDQSHQYGKYKKDPTKGAINIIGEAFAEQAGNFLSKIYDITDSMNNNGININVINSQSDIGVYQAMNPIAGSFTATNNDDFIEGSFANEVIKPLNGDDFVLAGDGNDLIEDTSGGRNVFKGQGGNDVIIIHSNQTFNELDGGEDDDHLTAFAPVSILSGGSGNDTYKLNTTSKGSRIVDAEGKNVLTIDGVSELKFSRSVDNLFIHFDNNLAYDEFDDIVWLGFFKGNNNTVNEFSQSVLDNLTTANAADNIGRIITGDATNNILDGGAGNDVLNGGADNDILNGGAGNDVLNPGYNQGATDTVDGGSDTDTLQVDYSSKTDGGGIHLGHQNTNHIWNRNGGQILVNVSNVENYNITGTQYADVFEGRAGNDIFNGGYGNDLLTGGLGKDALTGGLGTDRFDYRNLADSLLNNFDVITDFNANEDKFVVSNPLSEFFSAFFVTTLDVNSISGILTSTDFQANAAARFQLLSFGFKNITTRTRTFVAINDGIAGFDANTDAIIEVTGLTGTLGLNNFTTTLA